MACFLVPAAEAIVTTAVERIISKKECSSGISNADANGEVKTPFSRKLRRLNTMLWGGSALLAFEHIWHGEVTPWFPFLTSATNPADAFEMLHEMATSGVAMAMLVTVLWAAITAAASAIEKRPDAPEIAVKGVVR